MNIISQEDSNEVEEILKDVEKKLKFEYSSIKIYSKLKNFWKRMIGKLC